MNIIPLEQASAYNTDEVGGKATGLGSLICNGFPTAPGFVVTTSACTRLIASPNSELQNQIYEAFDYLNSPWVAVRSSGVHEDSPGASWAGQFETFLCINRVNLIESIIKCCHSANNQRAKAYSLDGPMKLAVIIQSMIASDVSGVMFTMNPVTKNHDQIIIEAVYGLGEMLVQGSTNPDSYTIDKQTFKLIDHEIVLKTKQLGFNGKELVELQIEPTKQILPTLSSKQLQELSELATTLERRFDSALDVEWSYKDDKLYLLQIRPVTTL